MIPKIVLQDLYLQKKLSIAQTAVRLGVNLKTIGYWMKRHKVKPRARTDAMYAFYNPNGDPFNVKSSLNNKEYFLKGLGIGLFWGEGTKLNKNSLRVANTDPSLILQYRNFLTKICGVHISKIKYSLQIFGDMPKGKVVDFWCKTLNVLPKQFGKITITPHRGIGNYKTKSKFGVLQIAVHNKKLKQWMDNEIKKLDLCRCSSAGRATPW